MYYQLDPRIHMAYATHATLIRRSIGLNMSAAIAPPSLRIATIPTTG